MAGERHGRARSVRRLTTGVILGAAVTIIGAGIVWHHGDASAPDQLSIEGGPKSTTPSAPPLLGATRVDEDGGISASGPAPSGIDASDRLRIAGVVLNRSGDGVQAEVWITNPRRMGRALRVATSDMTGRFGGAVACGDLGSPGEVSVWATVDGPDRWASAPVQRPVTQTMHLRDLRLTMLPGARVRVRVVGDDLSEPVPQAQLVFAVLVVGHGTQYFSASADREGVCSAVLPSGAVQVRARRQGGAFGAPVRGTIADLRASEDLGDVVAPTEAYRVPIQVVGDGGDPIAGAYVRTSDHASRFLHETTPGELVHFRTNEQGKVLLPPMAITSFPLTVAVASPRYVTKAVAVAAPLSAKRVDTVKIVLGGRPGVRVALVDADGSVLSQLPALSWSAQPLSSSGAPSGPPDESYPLAVMTRGISVAPNDDGTYRIYTPQKGAYVFRLHLAGGMQAELRATARPPAELETHRVNLPRGRLVRVHVRVPSRSESEAIFGSVRFRWVLASSAEGERRHLPPWTIDLAGKGLRSSLWAPEDVRALSLSGVGPLRAPWSSVTRDVRGGPEAAVQFDLRELSDGGGRLHVLMTPAGDASGGPSATVVIRGDKSTSASEWLMLEPDSSGRLDIDLPPGVVFLARSDVRGPPIRVEVRAGHEVNVELQTASGLKDAPR